MTDFSRPPVDMALWRYGIISPLLHRHEDSPPLYRELCTLAGQPYYTPEGQAKRLSADTLRLWLWRYNNLGLPGLSNKVRKDRGGSKVPEALHDALVLLRKAPSTLHRQAPFELPIGKKALGRPKTKPDSPLSSHRCTKAGASCPSQSRKR